MLRFPPAEPKSVVFQYVWFTRVPQYPPPPCMSSLGGPVLDESSLSSKEASGVKDRPANLEILAEELC